MKHSILALAAACALAAADAGAQTCAAPALLAPNSMVQGSTCGFPKLADVFCDGTPNPGPNVVYRLTLEQASEVEFAIGSTSFEPALFVSDEACGHGRCVSAIQSGQPMPAGDYWVVVAAAEGSAEGTCGTFTLANAVTPAETIFSDSFD